MSGEASGITARGYSWPPFEVGNQAALRHGAHSERTLSPLVDQLIESLALVAPWCSGAVFAPTVQSWAWAEAKAITYRRHFDSVGMAVEAEEPAKGLDQWDRAERRAATLRTELGLSPSSLTRLLSGLSSIDAPAAQSGLEALRAAGAALRSAAGSGVAATGAGALLDQGEVGALGGLSGVEDPPGRVGAEALGLELGSVELGERDDADASGELVGDEQEEEARRRHGESLS